LGDNRGDDAGDADYTNVFINFEGTYKQLWSGNNEDTVRRQTFSDIRLKENIIDLNPTLDKIKSIKSINFNWNEMFIEKQIKEAFHLTRMLEHECEQMSASLVREFDLPVDTRRLQKKGNAYLIFYHAVEKNRKWSTKKSIYTQDILQNMPNVIQDKYIECEPKTKLKLLENCF
jgi:hypothetical protein